jgi:cell wall-associated NlpC family hydrolase
MCTHKSRIIPRVGTQNCANIDKTSFFVNVCLFQLISYNRALTKITHTSYLLCILLALVSTSCAAVEPKAEKADAQNEALVSQYENEGNWSERAREVLVNALSLTGVRYKYGGNSPETGFDCSGFVRYVFKQATSLTLPRSAIEISQLGTTIPKHELQPGDLVFFNTLKSAFSHVGIYVGNNRFIHSPSSGGKVRVESMQDGYWAKRFNGAQRIENSKEASQ